MVAHAKAVSGAAQPSHTSMRSSMTSTQASLSSHGEEQLERLELTVFWRQPFEYVDLVRIVTMHL